MKKTQEKILKSTTFVAQQCNIHKKNPKKNYHLNLKKNNVFCSKCEKLRSYFPRLKIIALKTSQVSKKSGFALAHCNLRQHIATRKSSFGHYFCLENSKILIHGTAHRIRGISMARSKIAGFWLYPMLNIGVVPFTVFSSSQFFPV